MCVYEVLARFPCLQAYRYLSSFITVWLLRPWGARYFGALRLDSLGKHPTRAGLPWASLLLAWPYNIMCQAECCDKWVPASFWPRWRRSWTPAQPVPPVLFPLLCFVMFTVSASLFMRRCLFRSKIQFITVWQRWIYTSGLFCEVLSSVPETSSHLIPQSEAEG